MARRRPRPTLSAIATLDVDIARKRQQCEDRVLRASNRLMQPRNGAKPSFHDRYLEIFRGLFDSEANRRQILASTWPQSTLQAFLTRFFDGYQHPAAFAAVWGALDAGNAASGVDNGDKWIQIESFDVLKRALLHTTAARLPTHHPHARTHAIAALQEPEHSPPDHKRDSFPGASADDHATPYSVPANSVVVGSELRVHVLKKSQNWLGRWRSRQLGLRWNELEMATTSGSHTHNRHSVARSFPSQLPVLSTDPRTAKSYVPPPSGPADLSSSRAASKSKQYPLQNLISLQLIELNDSEPTRKVALDLHFKQKAANGLGFTTKSLIVTPQPQPQPRLTAKELMSAIATLALFRALAARELQPRVLQKWVHAGANVHAFCTVPEPSLRPAALLCPLQFAVLQYCQSQEDAAWLATAKMLLEDAKADPRSLLHWQFARRVLLLPQRSTLALRALVALLDTPWITAFGSDAHGWTLLMYASEMEDPVMIQELLDRAKTRVPNAELRRYIQHMNGDGETALELAIRAAKRGGVGTRGEDVAIAIADASVHAGGDDTRDDAMRVLQLALAAKLWRLVDGLLLQHPATRGGDPPLAISLVQAIRSHAPPHVVAAIVARFSENWARDDATLVATALALAVDNGRDDIVEILLTACARDAAALSEAAMCGEDSVMRVAIRTGMAEAAQLIYAAYSAASTGRGSGSRIRTADTVRFPSLVLLAVRHGMHRLAYEIATSHDGRLALDRAMAVAAAEASVLAIHAGQLELASVLLDTAVAADGGEQLPREKVLQALLAWAAPFTPPRSDHHASLFTLQVVEEMVTELLVRTATVDLDKFPSLLQATCSLAGSGDEPFSLRVLVLLLAFLRWKHGDAKAMLTSQVDGVTRETAVHIAMANGCFPCAWQLLHEVFPDATPQDDDKDEDDQADDDKDVVALQWMETPHATLLHLACRAPLADETLMAVDVLLQLGAYAGSWDVGGLTPLHVAIHHLCDARMVQVFAKNGQDLNVWSDAVRSGDGDDEGVPLTPLMAAVASNNVDAFRELVRCGADLRSQTPRRRLGILEFAASRRDGTGVDPAMLQELLQLQLQLLGASQATTATDAALGILRDRLRRLEASRVDSDAPESLPLVAQDDNRVLRITLLGLQTPDDDDATTGDAPLADIPITVTNTPPLSPSKALSLSPRSPCVRPPSIERRGSGRHQQIPSGLRSREPSPVRRLPAPPLQLDDDALRFLRDEERATLTLVAQEAKTEAQQWLAKRSGQKKLLSEARALLQRTETSRTTGHPHHHPHSSSSSNSSSSSSSSSSHPVETIVTDAQLLETYKTLAARQFIDKHVAEAVGDARAAIDREKTALLQATGIFPGDAHHPSAAAAMARARDASIGSTSWLPPASSSSSSGVQMHRTASLNSSMLLLFSGSARDTVLSERGGAGRGDGSYEELLLSSSLDRESFVHHVADARKSLS